MTIRLAAAVRRVGPRGDQQGDVIVLRWVLVHKRDLQLASRPYKYTYIHMRIESLYAAFLKVSTNPKGHGIRSRPDSLAREEGRTPSIGICLANTSASRLLNLHVIKYLDIPYS